MRDSEVDGSGVTPDTGPLGSPPGDLRRVAPADRAGEVASGRLAGLKRRLLAMRERVYSTKLGRIGVKLVVAVVGTAVIAVGVVLLPLPGPGWVVILGGLAILAIEFHWARRLLAFTKAQLLRWTALVREGSWLVRIVSVGGLLLVVGAAMLLSWRLLA